MRKVSYFFFTVPHLSPFGRDFAKFTFDNFFCSYLPPRVQSTKWKFRLFHTDWSHVTMFARRSNDIFQFYSSLRRWCGHQVHFKVKFIISAMSNYAVNLLREKPIKAIYENHLSTCTGHNKLSAVRTSTMSQNIIDLEPAPFSVIVDDAKHPRREKIIHICENK